MAITLPTSADVRKVRSQVNKFATNQFELVRTPVLAWIGVGDLAVHTLRELPERLSRDELRKRADDATDKARETYHEWVERGEDRVERVRAQPQVARALRSVKDANQRFDRQVEKIVDELHDGGEEVLDAVSFETRSVGEKTARRTQRMAREAATTLTEAGNEFAESVVEAGDEAAHDTRSLTRSAANKTAPTTSDNQRRNANAKK